MKLFEYLSAFLTVFPREFDMSQLTNAMNYLIGYDSIYYKYRRDPGAIGAFTAKPLHWTILYPRRLLIALFWGIASIALSLFALIAVKVALHLTVQSVDMFRLLNFWATFRAVGTLFAAYTLGVLVSLFALSAGMFAWWEALKIAGGGGAKIRGAARN